MKAISVFVLFASLFVASAADAQKIDPRCAKMRDKLGCTCAVQNGGEIKGNRWASARKTNSGKPTNQAFTQCLIAHGRH